MAYGQGPKPIGAVWKIAAAGMAAIAVAAAFDLFQTSSNIIVAFRVLLTLGGALTIGIALYMRPGHTRLYAFACAAAIVARFGFPPDWDSGLIASGLAAVFAGIGAILTALPSGYRKVAISALMLFHFGGIAVAVTSPLYPPWMSLTIGTLLYRPYLQSLYLTNAYHFYSPQPGPASQVWFCVKYAKDSSGNTRQRWYKFPRRPDDLTDPMGLSYYRRLSITMNLESSEPSVVSEDMRRRRIVMTQGDDGIPIHNEVVPLDSQYRLPQMNIREFVLPSYVQHIANLKILRHPEGVPITSIRVYLVTHNIMTQVALENDISPYDPITYMPYYFGEYDTSGKLLDPGNPLLYWLIPIIRVPTHPIPPWHTFRSNPEEFKLIDGVKRHNGNVDHDMAKEWTEDEQKADAKTGR
jgi:hypothetical protein